MDQIRKKQNNDDPDNGGLGKLHPKEISLLRNIRERYQYGTIEIQTADGYPKQIIQTITRELLE